MISTNQPRLYQPKIQDVVSYLKQFPFVCEVCHHNNWTVYMEADEKVSVAAMNRLLENYENPDADFTIEPTKTATPVIQVQCKHCGQVKYFALHFVLDAINKTQRNSDGN